ncbi:unnamed protein product, partial [Arabidopsis halleri]
MKEHKNPKVLSEGFLWMVSTVDEFGVSLMKLKGTAAPKRVSKTSISTSTCTGAPNSLPREVIKLFGGVAAAMGPTIERASKGILSDVLKCLTNNMKHMGEYLFDWLTKQLAGSSDFVDAIYLLKPASNRNDG